MVTGLTGENSFALQRELSRLVGAFITEHGDIAVERLDAAEAGMERIRESLQSAPFLAARKLVILRAPSLNKTFVDAAEDLLSNIAETTDLIIIEPKLDKRSTYYKWLKRHVVLQEFPELDEAGLTKWLVDSAKGQGGKLSNADARLLVERVGLRQQLLSRELEKLVIYSPHITRETIELLVEAMPQSQIFDLLDAAFSGNAKRALVLYHDQREQKVDPSQIIAMLAWQLRVLALLVASGQRSPHEIVREAKLSPYTVQKSMPVADRLTPARLKQLVTGLLAIDLRSKRENISLDEALENYLLILAQ